MPADRTVLEHLLQGRDALVLEVERLTTAIAELDSVIGHIGGVGRRIEESSSAATGVTPLSGASQPVNPRGEVEPDGSTNITAGATTRPGRAVRASANVSAGRPRRQPAKAVTEPGSTGEAPKSIRIHVLEMLTAENRDFGLAEIIDRIHGEGIQAHDDAVRSITIKLMKDGRVERVGRGLYRLAGRSTAPEPTPAEPAVENYVPPLDLGQTWQRPVTDSS